MRCLAVRLLVILSIFFAIIPAYAEGPSVIKLSLRKALKIGQERHADVLMADERVQQALSRVGQSRAGLLPQVHGILNAGRQTRDLRGQGIALPGDPHVGPFNSVDARVRLTQALLDPSAISRMEQAAHGKQLSVSEARKVQSDVLALVAILFINARQSDADFKSRRAELAFVYQNFLAAKTSFRQGVISQSDWEDVQVNLARSYAQYHQAKSQEARDRLELCAALNLPLDAVIEYLSDDLGINVDQAQQRNWARPADVEVAQDRVTLNIAQRNVERSQQWPQIAALADYGRTGESFDEASNTYTVGLQVSVPFWEGGLRTEKIKEAESRLRESQWELERTRRANHARLLESVEAMQAAKVSQTKAKWQSKAQARQFKIAMQKYKNGSGSLVDVYQSWSVKSAIRAQENDAFSAYQLAQINVAHALGLLTEIVKEPHQ
ncbi:MAG: TolC family protein [Candidatus Omnitrophica bacterium]|nr:TolC family protein [Candidatus Omnitrophota bacterium]